MNDREKRKEELRKKSEVSKERTDALLSEEIEALKKATKSDLENLRPKIADKEVYDELIAIVEDATSKNESLAELKGRIEKLGLKGIDIVKEVVKLLKAL